MVIWHLRTKVHDKIISTRINSDVLVKLDKFCSTYYLTRAECIEFLIEHFLEDLLKYRY